MGIKESDIFNVVIQAGAILAVVFIYWHKIVDLFRSLDHAESRNYLLKVLLAFVTTMVLVLILTVKLKLKLPETLTPVAWATFIGGLVIFAVEAFAKNLYPHEEDVSWFESILIGVGQVVAAIFPGASRSGSTIMAGLGGGDEEKRPSVTEFTFLVGIPTMFAASAYASFKDRDDFHHMGSQLIIDTAIGFFVSMVVAFFVVKWLLRFVQSHTFSSFALYRVILGGGLLIGLYTHTISDVSAEAVKAPTPLVPAPIVVPALARAGCHDRNTGNSIAPITNAEVTPVTACCVAPTTDVPAPATNARSSRRALAGETRADSRPMQMRRLCRRYEWDKCKPASNFLIRKRRDGIDARGQLINRCSIFGRFRTPILPVLTRYSIHAGFLNQPSQTRGTCVRLRVIPR